MNASAPIGVTLVGGFLGAGKTTLVNHILRHDPRRRIGVLVNDFGAINIDADLIAAREGDAIRLTNGCLCCGVGDSLSRALIEMLAQSVRPGHLLIEASGVAEPWRIAELIGAAHEFAPPTTLVVVDGSRIEVQLADRYIGDLARSQIESADLLVLNKMDLVAATTQAALVGRMHDAWPLKHLAITIQGRIDLERLAVIPRPSRFHASRPPVVAAADRFVGLRFVTKVPFSAPRLDAAMAAMPPWIFRLKGIVRLAGEETPQNLQFTPARWSLTALTHRSSSPTSRIVAIARHDYADDDTLDRLLTTALIQPREAGVWSAG
ncbi:CobW family GTP-binding protein [Acidiphilium acidophilum]|uniref:CobW family GTP-binding protein n=1 Tax=Acidiphilium acidophilum TaxID=76588 RepID=UPI002E8E62E9|nr:CobW family GTP-binding protein [Acidiphilium acidophilum]